MTMGLFKHSPHLRRVIPWSDCRQSWARLSSSSIAGDHGVACVLTSLEQGRTFVSYTPRWKVASGDANYRVIKSCRKRFLHYYWYVLDPVMGPMSIRVA